MVQKFGIKKTLIILLFLNACSSPSEVSKSDQIIIEVNPGPTDYDRQYGDNSFRLRGCELICIGERNFTHSKFKYPKKSKQSYDFQSLVETGYEKLFNKNKSVFTYTNICELSKRNKSKSQLICAMGGKQNIGYNEDGIQLLRGGQTTCFPYNKFESEDFEINRVVEMCNKQSADLMSNYYADREQEQRQFQEDYTNSLISFCDKIGFKTGTESNGNCVLRILDTSRELNEEEVTSSSTKIIVEKENSLTNSLLLMQMGLNLMNPPQPKLNCTTNLFGWTCY